MNIGVTIIGIIIVVLLIALVIRTNNEQRGVSEAELLERNKRVQYDTTLADNVLAGASIMFNLLQYSLDVSTRREALIVIFASILGILIGCVSLVLGHPLWRLFVIPFLTMPIGVFKLLVPNGREWRRNK